MLMKFSIINHPAIGVPPFMETLIYTYTYTYTYTCLCLCINHVSQIGYVQRAFQDLHLFQITHVFCVERLVKLDATKPQCEEDPQLGPVKMTSIDCDLCLTSHT